MYFSLSYFTSNQYVLRYDYNIISVTRLIVLQVILHYVLKYVNMQGTSQKENSVIISPHIYGCIVYDKQ